MIDCLRIWEIWRMEEAFNGDAADLQTMEIVWRSLMLGIHG